VGYSTGCHMAFHHRYHLVWALKHRFNVLNAEVQLRVREIICQVCAELRVMIAIEATSLQNLAQFRIETDGYFS